MTKTILARIAVLLGLFLLAALGVPKAFAQSTSVTVTAGDPGDLDCGDMATATASAIINNPPTAQNEGTLEQHWTWSINTGDSSTVYIDHPDASSTTYHCEHDDPGDYSIQVTASVTLHDPATGTDYGPYSGSDTFGDTASDPPATNGIPFSGETAASSHASPQSAPASKHYPARLHFRVTIIGKIAHIQYTAHNINGNLFWGFKDLWRLGTVYTKGGLFKKGTLNESFPTSTYFPNPHWIQYFPNPPKPVPGAHPNGYIEDTNHVEINRDTTPDTHWFTVDQHFSNQGPDGAADNYHTDSADQPTSSRTAH